MKDLDSYVERLQNSFETTMRKIISEVSESKDCDLTRAQYYILYMLSKKPYYTSSDLAQKLEVKPSAVTVMIDRLLNTNLVTRERDENDRRIVKIKITTEGTNILKKAMQKRNEIYKRYLSHLEEHELDSLLNIYEKLARITKGEQ